MRLPLRRYWRLLARYLLPQSRALLLLAALLLGGIAMELVAPQLLRTFLDRAQDSEPLRALYATAALFIGVTTLAQLAAVVETYIAETVGWIATNRLRADLAEHCLHLDLAFHHARTPGELIERIDGDVTSLANFFSRFTVAIVGNALLLLGVLALLWREDWRIGLGVGLFALATLTAMLRLYTAAQPRWAAVSQESALFYGFVGERLTGAEDIRTSGASAVAQTLHRFAERIRRWRGLLLRAVFMGQAVWMAALSLLALANALALLIAARQVLSGGATIGTVYLIATYTTLLMRPIGRLQAEIQDLQQAGASIGRIEALFAARSAIQDGPGVPLPTGPLAVELANVSFTYGDGPPALRTVDLNIPAGTTLGLLGRTGSGKTTLARLLPRLYDPTAGVVCLGGVDVRQAQLSDLRSRIGLVPQEVQLLAASVRDNLTFGDPAIPDDRLRDAIAALGLRPWFDALPAGLDTPLAPGGGLSAGEAQLLAFVRVFLKNPGLVILDEASSRLDPVTERLLAGAIDRLLRGRTAIIIAHHLATIRRVDAIAILEAGAIIEYGPREALSRDETSRFSRLLRLAADDRRDLEELL
ncbi:MAG: ABC transporter ATP-binding protein [Chloroflexia bacterium]